MRSRVMVLLAALMLVVTAAPAAANTSFPEIVPLPDGFQPEGVVIGYGSTVYAGSLADGSIWRGDLRSGSGDVLVDGETGDVAVGLSFDRRTGHLWVSGGPGAVGRVYNGRTGALLHEFELAPGFINDVIVTWDAAYFTNSFAPEIYRVPLTTRGEVAGAVETVPLGGDFQFEEGQFNANGIEAARSGKVLIIVNSFAGEIYTVDPDTGQARAIDLGGVVVNGDGLLLVGRTLYAVENVKNQIAEIHLQKSLRTGEVVDYITSPAFDVPTTVDNLGRFLYAVNAKFGTTPTPDTPYEIVRVRR